jgi:hypothetical protein
VLEAQRKRRPAMKKVSTAARKQSRNISRQKLTIGLDLGDRNSWYCVLDETGQIQQEQRLRTTVKALREVFAAIACAAPAWVPVIWWKPHSLVLIRVPLLFASLSSLLQVMFVTLVAIGATSLGYSLGFCAVGISCSLFVILWAMCNPRTILLSLGAVISSSLTIAMWLFLAMLH